VTGVRAPAAAGAAPWREARPTTARPRSVTRLHATLPRWAGHLALAVLLLAGLGLAVGATHGGYTVDTASAATPRWVDGPLRTPGQVLGGLTPGTWSLALTVMLVSYLVIFACARALSPRTVWITIALANGVFLLAPTLVSTDVFGYVSYARLAVLHGLNPYLNAPISVPHDALLGLVYWRHATTPYGPLFTLATYPLALVTPWLAVWTLKAAAAVAAIGLAAVVSRLAARRGADPVRAAVLVGLNPVILVYAVSGAHNDLEATLVVALGLSVAAAGRQGRGAALLVAGAAIKVTAGLALPFLVMGSRRPRAALTAGAGAVLVVAALTTALFGTHVLDQLRRISSDPVFDIAGSGPARLGGLLGTGIDTTVRAACTGAAGIVLLIELARVRRGADWIACAGWATLALMGAIASFAPWYVVWLAPLAALGRSRRLTVAALMVSAYVVAIHLTWLGGAPWLSGPND